MPKITLTKWFISISRIRCSKLRPLASVVIPLSHANPTLTSCDSALLQIRLQSPKANSINRSTSWAPLTDWWLQIRIRFAIWASRVTASICFSTQWTQWMTSNGVTSSNVTNSSTKLLALARRCVTRPSYLKAHSFSPKIRNCLKRSQDLGALK